MARRLGCWRDGAVPRLSRLKSRNTLRESAVSSSELRRPNHIRGQKICTVGMYPHESPVLPRHMLFSCHPTSRCEHGIGKSRAYSMRGDIDTTYRKSQHQTRIEVRKGMREGSTWRQRRNARGMQIGSRSSQRSNAASYG